MFILIVRTIILYIYLIIIMRVMGKRQIGQLEPVDFVVALMISELATLPMSDNRIPLIYAIVPITTLVFLQVFTSFLELKSEGFRVILNGEPSIVVKDGLVNVEELRQLRYNLEDLLAELRQQGFFNLMEVHYAILETDGSLSVLPYTPYMCPNKEDLNIHSPNEPLPMPVILDGIVNIENLTLIGKDEPWLKKILSSNNIKSPKEVLIAIIYSDEDKLYYQLKSKVPTIMKPKK